MATRAPRVTGEWYHCYNRGTDKRVVFTEPAEYERFITLLYTCNGTNPVRISDSSDTNLASFFERKRGAPLVEIAAYSLMPTHSHLVLKQLLDNGIAFFIQKVFTGYTMYFNLRHQRSGALFAGTYKAKHIVDDRYLKQVIPYVLLNPAELFEPRWKDGIGKIARIKEQLSAYPYSSLPELHGAQRPEGKILVDSFHDLYDSYPALETMLEDAQEYYRENPKV